MRDKTKTKEQLIRELAELRQQIAELEQAKNERAKETGGRSEEHLQEIIDCVKDGIVILDLTGTVTTINKRVTEVAGYAEEDIIGKRLTRLKMFPPKSIVTMFTAFTHVVSGQQPSPYEVEVHTKTGEKLVVEIHGSLLRKGGEKAGVVAVLRDVTERKQLEALLLRERETFVTILQHALYGVALLDKEGKHLYVNHAFTAITGYTLEDIPSGRDWLLKAYPDEAYRKRITALWRKDRGLGGKSREINVVCKNGETKEIEFSTTVLDDGRAVVMLSDITKRKRAEEALQRHREHLEELVTERTAALQDANAQLQQEITERKEADEKLKESEERFRTVFEMAHDLIFIKDRDLKFTAVNPAIEKYYNISAAEMIGKTNTALLEKKVALRSRKEDLRVLKGEIVDSEHEFEVQGDTVIQNVVKVPMRNSDGEIIGLCGIARDITERKQAEEALQDSEERLKILFEFAPDAYYVNDLTGTFIDGNRAAEETTGYKKEELIGKNFLKLKLLPTNQIPKAAALLAQNALGKTTGPDEFTLNRKDGSQVPLEIRTYPIKIKGQTLVLGIARDITERKRAEEALRDSEARYRAIVEAFDGLIYVCSQDYRIEFMNKQLLERTGYDGTGKLCYKVLHDLDSICPWCVNKQVFAGETVRWEVQSPKDNRWYYVVNTPIYHPDGSMSKQAMILDVTEHKQAEMALRESEERFRKVVETMKVGLATTDKNGILTYVNEFSSSMIGYSVDDMIGHDPTEFYYDEKERKAQKEIFKKRKKGMRDAPTHEVAWRTKDGRKVYSILTPTPLFDAEGRYQGSFAIHTEITERKRIEGALRESEEKYRELINGMNDTAWVIDFDGNFIDVNDAAVEVLGYSREELLVMGPHDIDTTLDAETITDLIKGMQTDKIQVFETTHTTKDGNAIPVEIKSSLVTYQGKQAILSIARDITERKHAAEALRESEERFRSLVETMKVGLSTIDRNGVITYVNEHFCNMLGYSMEEIIGHPTIDFYYDDEERKEQLKRFEQRKAGDRSVSPHEITWRTKEGQKLHTIVSPTPSFDEDGCYTDSFAIITDITKRKQAEEALRESESRFRLLVEHSVDAVILHDLDGKILDANQHACDSLGYTRNELLGLYVHDIDQNFIQGRYKEMWEEMVPGEPITLEGVSRRKDGTTFPTEVRLGVFKSGARKLILALARDVTERIRAEKTIRKLAYHDALTGLPNRVLFVDRLKHAIAQAHRKQNKLAVMLLDLDHFKDINDTLGHSVGDQLLSGVGKRLTGLLRKEDTISRMGGDEFFLLLPEIDGVQDAATIAQKVLNAFQEEPFVLDDHDVNITTSIGVAIYPDDGKAVKTLLRNSDVALYQAKQTGRNNYQHYTQEMDPESQADK